MTYTRAIRLMVEKIESGKVSEASGLLEKVIRFKRDKMIRQMNEAVSQSDVENFIRDSLSGTTRTATKDTMYNLVKNSLNRSTDYKIYTRAWNGLISDGYLVKASGNQYAWENI